MKKIKLILFLLFVIPSCCGCEINNSSVQNSSTQTDNQSSLSATSSEVYGKNDEIVLKSDILPSDIQVRGIKNENNFYYFNYKENNSIYIYNTNNNSRELIKKPISNKKIIITAAFSEKWLIWVEDEDLNASNENQPTSKNWSLYAQNLETNELLSIDGYKNIEINTSVGVSYAPEAISISNDNFVYRTFDRLADGNVYAVIKLYNFAEKKSYIIDSIKDYYNNLYSDPQISGSNIVWSVSQLNLKQQSDENGNVFLYNLDSKEKMQISNDDETTSPYIYNNYIVARLKPNGQNENSELLLYDLTGDQKWKSIINPDNPEYVEEKHIEIYNGIISGGYLMWSDNVQKSLVLYDLNNNQFYELYASKNSNDNSLPFNICNNVLFWYQVDRSDPDSTITKNMYTILK